MHGKKVALVTGANKGIGLEIARQLASKDFTVVVGARDDSKGAEAAARLRGQGLDVMNVKLDVTERATADAQIAETHERPRPVSPLADRI